MGARKLAFYCAWHRSAETGAPIEILDNRFPALFESRRMLYPKLAELSDPSRFEQGIGGFIDHVLRRNFTHFLEQARDLHGCAVNEIFRGDAGGRTAALDGTVLAGVDTLIVISFDSIRTAQVASDAEVDAVRRFLSTPGHIAFICPHHHIGDGPAGGTDGLHEDQLTEFLHHGDKTIPPQQRFGGFARSLLAGLGVPVENRFGLRPAAGADGAPTPIEVETSCDRHGLLRDVATFNLHLHLPQLERLGPAREQLDVVARQRIDLSAPPHPFTRGGRATFDVLLQSRPGVFAGTLLVSDATLWSSTAGGVESLQCLWRNVLARAGHADARIQA